MPQLELTPEEVRELTEVLTSYLSDLRMEVAGTDNFDFRQNLKRREALLKRLIEHLQAAPPAPRKRMT
jgi:hypothetical protein